MRRASEIDEKPAAPSISIHDAAPDMSGAAIPLLLITRQLSSQFFQVYLVVEPDSTKLP